MLHDGTWDEHLDFAIVASTYKKGDSTKFENYRPISLSQTCVRILAFMLQTRISMALDHTITDMQFGF